MDYYSILGVEKTATQDEIKSAFRKLAMKYHPDRGGDEAKFKQVSEAYDTLSNPEKRKVYDTGGRGNFNGTEFHYTTDNPFDIFGQMFSGQHPFEHMFRQAGNRQRQKNKDLNIRCQITLKQSYTGTDLEAKYQLPSGKSQTVIIKVPAGIQSGQTIRYQNMGDDSMPNLPRGDLNVTIIVEPNKEYERRGDDLVTYLLINPLEAMIGCTKRVRTLDDKEIELKLNPGMQQGSEFTTRGMGFSNLNGYTGNFVAQVKILVPRVTDPQLKEQLEKLYAQISKTS